MVWDLLASFQYIFLIHFNIHKHFNFLPYSTGKKIHGFYFLENKLTKM